MQTNGWIKLHRKALENGWLRNHKVWVFWTYCLLKASHDHHTHFVGYDQVELAPGQFVFGRNKASEDLNMSPQSVRTCLKILKKSKNLTIQSTNRYSIITILKWDTYQGNIKSDQPADQPASNQQVTSKQPATNHKQELKNYKNERIKEKSFTHPLQTFVGENLSKVAKLEKQLTEENCRKLLEKYPSEMVTNVLQDMDNYKPLLKNYVDVYRTCNNWCAKRLKDGNGKHPKSDKDKSLTQRISDWEQYADHIMGVSQNDQR